MQIQNLYIKISREGKLIKPYSKYIQMKLFFPSQQTCFYLLVRFLCLNLSLFSLKKTNLSLFIKTNVSASILFLPNLILSYLVIQLFISFLLVCLMYVFITEIHYTNQIKNIYSQINFLDLPITVCRGAKIFLKFKIFTLYDHFYAL